MKTAEQSLRNTAQHLSREIVRLESKLAQCPRNSADPDDQIAATIFEQLIRQKQKLLDTIQDDLRGRRSCLGRAVESREAHR